MNNFSELKNLYNQTSKHSNYQILPASLEKIVGGNEVKVKTRYEAERLKYILENIEIKGKYILDVGGNTGYFSFEAIDNGADKVVYYEGNKTHADFVRLAAKVLNEENKIEVHNYYLSIDNELQNSNFDVVLLLNVLHHIGDDYGSKVLTKEGVKIEIIKQLNSFADKTSTLVFQLGFNWKGNRDNGLFLNGTKRELIDFVEAHTKDIWKIEKIGIAELENGKIVYHDLNEQNIKRDDSLGEFLNRPIFIMKKRSAFNEMA